MATFATFWRHGSNTVLLLAALALAGLFATGTLAFAPFSLVFVALGAAVFFVSEYAAHRFLLHAPPQKNAAILKLQHRLHYDHHADPNELRLLFLPMWLVVPDAALKLALYVALTRTFAAGAAMLLGGVLGVLWYEWVHYVAHIPLVPKTRFGRWIKKYHLWHHFKNERMWFGVTNPGMDFAGRTYARVADVERSGNTRVLFPRDTTSV